VELGGWEDGRCRVRGSTEDKRRYSEEHCGRRKDKLAKERAVRAGSAQLGMHIRTMPSGHGMHAPDVALRKKPVVQGVQALGEVAPSESCCVPSGHGRQASAGGERGEKRREGRKGERGVPEIVLTLRTHDGQRAAGGLSMQSFARADLSERGDRRTSPVDSARTTRSGGLGRRAGP